MEVREREGGVGKWRVLFSLLFYLGFGKRERATESDKRRESYGTRDR